MSFFPRTTSTAHAVDPSIDSNVLLARTVDNSRIRLAQPSLRTYPN